MILYFSGNGNTRWCAETIAEATGDTAQSITKTARISLSPDEPLGLFFPVHGWKPPRIVLDFIDRMVIDQCSYCYAVCTCGDSIGEAMSVFAKHLKKKGVTLASAFSVIMPETYVALPFMYTDTIYSEQLKISNATKRLVSIADHVNRRAKGIEELTKGPLPWLFTHIVGAFFNKFMITDRPFKVDAGKCIHCGRCAKVCPVNNIAYDAHKLPMWQCRCTCCMACYHHCPRHAINYGSITRRREQYYFGIH